jgi:DNA-binding LacI/PurR family transcriptional regulator
MPYISEPPREAIDPHIPSLSENIHTVGDLNYAVTRLALRLLIAQGLHYSDIAAIVGTLHLAADEMGRRLIAEYEDLKIEENGDVEEYATLLQQIGVQRRNNYRHAPDTVQPHG